MIKRNDVIDFLRGCSILLVILLHCKIHLSIDPSLLSVVWIKWLLCSGYYGVMIFFVISGFLITSNCIRKWDQLKLINISEFYLMRFARISPCLIALLGIISLLHLMRVEGFIIHNTSLHEALFSAFTFRINWLEAKTGYLPANWDVLWSLSIEEVFYLFFPLMCLVFRKQKQIVLIMLIFIVLGPLARTKFTTNDYLSQYSYLSCMDGIAIGCLAAMISRKIKSIQLSKCIFVLGCLLFGFIFFLRKQAVDMGITSLGLNVTLLEMGVAMIILSTQKINFNCFRWIQWFGRNSYEIYLSHSFIVLFAANILYRSNQPTWLIVIEYCIVVLSSGLLGHFIAIYYSKPLNFYLREKKWMNKDSYSAENL